MRLSARLVLMTSLVALLAVVLTGLVASAAIRDQAEDQVREELGRQAALLATAPSLALKAQRREDKSAGDDGVLAGGVFPDGRALGAAKQLPAELRARLAGGGSFSGRVTVDGQQLLVEARPSRLGAVAVVTRPAEDVDRAADRLRGRLLVPLLVGLLGAALVGALGARVLARPLVQLGGAARRLAAGARGVALVPTGPPEVREVAHALSGLDSQLQATETARRQFLLSVSHELRTPLTSVRGFAEALADGVVSEQDVQRTGRIVLAEAERLERLVRDLLDLARLDAGEVSLQVCPVDLGTLVEDAALVWAGRCAASGVHLVIEVQSSFVLADPGRVRQVLDNLAENALRVTPAGGQLVLAVATGRLQVRDSGPGLTPQDTEVAFDRGALHARYRDERPVGTGLGLALAFRLVERMGGLITAGTAPEGGACFLVDLPADTGAG